MLLLLLLLLMKKVEVVVVNVVAGLADVAVVVPACENV